VRATGGGLDQKRIGLAGRPVNGSFVLHNKKMLLLPIIWEKGFKDSGIQGFECMSSKDFIKAFKQVIVGNFGFLM
jgi:hypothetical protein